MFMGCCCSNPSCGPCCRDRGCQSESVEARIVGVAGVAGPYNCSLNCTDAYADWTGLVTSGGVHFDGQCVWDNAVSMPEPTACGVDFPSIGPGAPFVTEGSFTLGFAQRRFECTGSVVNTPGECWLTAILTGDSTTSGLDESGPFTVIFEKLVTGPYPIDCEGLHELEYKCGTGYVGCDWTGATVEVNFVFNGACDPTMTFDPWTDDVDVAFESDCPEVDGVTDTMDNDATLTHPALQRWENTTGMGLASVFGVTASLVWDEGACDYALTLTQDGVTNCRLVGGTQTKHATATCDPFELLFESFELEEFPGEGGCDCDPNLFFDVRVQEPP